MRLDKYLKVSRIIKRRTVANEACNAGRVDLNGKTAKASTEIKIGDRLSILMGGKRLELRVTSVQEVAAKADAASMYELIGNEDASN